jgi:hypothetical protein
MGCKAKELFPFRGGLASAYAISKAYGLQHRTHLVQKQDGVKTRLFRSVSG